MPPHPPSFHLSRLQRHVQLEEDGTQNVSFTRTNSASRASILLNPSLIKPRSSGGGPPPKKNNRHGNSNAFLPWKDSNPFRNSQYSPLDDDDDEEESVEFDYNDDEKNIKKDDIWASSLRDILDPKRNVPSPKSNQRDSLSSLKFSSSPADYSLSKAIQLVKHHSSGSLGMVSTDDESHDDEEDSITPSPVAKIMVTTQDLQPASTVVAPTTTPKKEEASERIASVVPVITRSITVENLTEDSRDDPTVAAAAAAAPFMTVVAAASQEPTFKKEVSEPVASVITGTKVQENDDSVDDDSRVDAVIEESLAAMEAAMEKFDSFDGGGKTLAPRTPATDDANANSVAAARVRDAMAAAELRKSVFAESTALTTTVKKVEIDKARDFFKMDAFMCSDVDFQCCGPIREDDIEKKEDREITKTVTWDCPEDHDDPSLGGHHDDDHALETNEDDVHTLESHDDDDNQDSLLEAMEEAADELFFQDFVASQQQKTIRKEPWTELLFATGLDQEEPFDESLPFTFDDDASEESAVGTSPAPPPPELPAEDCNDKCHVAPTTPTTSCESFSSVSFESLDVFPAPGGFEIRLTEPESVEHSLLQHVTASLVQKKRSIKEESREQAVASERYLLDTPWLNNMFSEDEDEDDEVSCDDSYEDSIVHGQRHTTHQYLFVMGNAVTSDNWSLEDEENGKHDHGDTFDAFCGDNSYEDQEVIFNGVEVVGFARYGNDMAEI